MNRNSLRNYFLALIAGSVVSQISWAQPVVDSAAAAKGRDGPTNPLVASAPAMGDATRGKQVFRFETFGNEGFWTDAVRLPAGMVAAKLTPIQALKAGLMVDVDALDVTIREAVATELKTDLSPVNAPLLNDPMTTVKLVEANAVIGMVTKDSNGDGKLSIAGGDKVGATCALCHTVTDASVFNLPNGGSIGHRMDGMAAHTLNMGAIFAMASNTRALYPMLELSLKANKGKVLGRSPTGLTETSTEAQVDAYFRNPKFYPVGMFDDTFDGNGDPMHNSPLFRQDLAGPYGSDGSIAKLDNFSNLVFTSLLDMTTLTTPGGRAFLHKLAGPAGDELANNYVKVLAATGVKGYPYVVAGAHPMPGTESAPVGLRVDETKLLDLNAYMVAMQAPPGIKGDMQSMARGRDLFRSTGCTGCHNVDQAKAAPPFIVPMKTINPGDAPMVLAKRTPPLNPIMNSPGTFDDKMAVFNASIRNQERGTAMPLLLDLARKPRFLHDDSVLSLDALLNPARGPLVPHPFYLTDTAQRADMVAFLRGLDTGSASTMNRTTSAQ